MLPTHATPDNSIRLIAALIFGVALVGCGTNSDDQFRSFTEADVEETQSDSPAPSSTSSTSPEQGTSPTETAATTSETTSESREPTSAEMTAETPVVSSAGNASPPMPEQSAKEKETEKPLLAKVEPKPEMRAEPTDAPQPASENTPQPAEEEAPATSSDPATAEATPTEPRPIKLLVPYRTFPVEGPEEAVRITFDDLDLLKVLNMEPVPPDAVDHFPEWLAGLDGEKIRLRGWMFPPGRDMGLRGFLFVRDNQICCFGRSPKVYDKIGVRLRNGVTTNYIQGRSFDVVGTLHIEPDVEDGEMLWLYVIEDAIVIAD